MCYILPGLFYLKFTRVPGERWTGLQIGSAILMVLGCVIMPTALVFTFIADPYNPDTDLPCEQQARMPCQVPWPLPANASDAFVNFF